MRSRLWKCFINLDGEIPKALFFRHFYLHNFLFSQIIPVHTLCILCGYLKSAFPTLLPGRRVLEREKVDQSSNSKGGGDVTKGTLSWLLESCFSVLSRCIDLCFSNKENCDFCLGENQHSASNSQGTEQGERTVQFLTAAQVL